MSFALSPDSPDRKRSLEAETSSDEDETRGGRFKRQALNADAVDRAPRYAVIKDEDSAKSLPHEEGGEKSPPAASDSMREEHTAVEGDSSMESKLVCMRALISTKEAGVVIGKQGRNVADIRQNSGAKVTISELIHGAQDRILSVTGPLDQVAKAFSLVAEKMVSELQAGSEISVGERQTNLRILVPHTKMGWLIGKQGCRIKEIQGYSNARVTAHEGVLPGSTERIIQILGVMDAIHIAIYHIASTLQEYPQRDNFGFVPYRPLPMQMPLPLGGIPGAPPYAIPGPHAFFPPIPPGAMLPMPHHRGAPAPHLPVQMQQIFIPNDMVGAIIGKQGSKINEIRHLSGSQIKIMEPQMGSSERLVTITGNPEQNQMALYLLYSRLESEKARMQGHVR
ncbi:uncharacterized protein SPPG_06253 [Spizellomyces punctatus DAOM BR117]|uniref:K Homology domain-containing protein n=1 Tax=Spizellomyces punctatus (strain DAOM BR117) TaxID=645134 RepID=A0A0L0HBL3_SPIPD|nr:hypothetical protein, variant 2 [Spizellomyces punctatus DAOM BR117]XP_016606607.1 hypothetical protein, variant 1 [Spizellomyces punctatus DAOM BR117]XP_016606608.1 uncharacterized protein SPPG_06253 [Spizellomyces punctatus DAOM BR117]KNC98566.1 hypothetical protein, variant 2 [Spizellomyces punctatus DAOM BR117]KNC98567.1 hypothetical protein, variant 1 [Spizellomyces punctatus DAOM BR117]KNC98568.1 hypothetical protein SPPG_06253 [Spizellomyces punctatus DAOM BR117]|eukprot:XP_016606606.1 hypothetical protein, variant 2 [Spizellomyces punctatus DAOM BR117]